ncbi:ankyrin repeat domain-containing protein [Lyngbya confervoides]|uniref:Ankyrin repeat domain-containing protein n=1 Tax=Lyngbya confervoides BDU141951 TaxID=1574623 RepID=A0ABD4T1G3_9CYAN|nr:ankyrin repeat domain-containing protein [Lyngbya confervoides]MCM1982547.1 ankyrin repeat domain-containing protein [Lyngbya confervoides BDU141951]
MNDDWYQKEQLHFAAQSGDLARVEHLVKAGLDVDAFDEIGKTPLHYAAEKEHFKVARYLLAHGANANAYHEQTISNTPLGDIAARCSLQMAQLLVDAGADPTIRGWMGLTALHRAKERKKEEGQRVYELLARISMHHA